MKTIATHMIQILLINVFYLEFLLTRNVYTLLLLLSIQIDSVVGRFYLGNYVSLLLHSKFFIFLLHSNLFSANFKFFSIPFSPVISETISIHLIFLLPLPIFLSLDLIHSLSYFPADPLAT